MTTGKTSAPILFLLAAAVVCCAPVTGLAQQEPTKPPPVLPKPLLSAPVQVQSSGLVDFFTSRTPYEFWLAVLVALTGCYVISLLAHRIAMMKSVRPEDLTRPAIVITIITSSLILIIAGFSNEQIAAAFGLFGTIVGYMLGRMNTAHQKSDAAAATPAAAEAAPERASAGDNQP